MYRCSTLADKCWQAQPLQLPHLQQATLQPQQPPLPQKVCLCSKPCPVKSIIGMLLLC